MRSNYFDPKSIIASALISTGLFGITPVVAEEISNTEKIQNTRVQTDPRLETQLCNHRFQCSRTGMIIHFLPNSKATFLHPNSEVKLIANYVIHFNRDISVNVYKNPSIAFDFILHDIVTQDKGFRTQVNHEDRYFQKV